MKDAALDWTTAPGALRTEVHRFVWIADLSLKKLSPDDAEAMRQHRDDLQGSLDQLLETLSQLVPPAAAEIERCAARLLHAVGWIWQLTPLPVPNARKRVSGENPKKARGGRAKKPRAVAIDKACKEQFDALRSEREAHPWKAAGRAASNINKSLNLRGKDEVTQNAVSKRFRKLAKERS